MCGIAGIFCKSESAEERLGEYVSSMLGELTDRGPDSAGVAIYRDRVDDGGAKLSLRVAEGRHRAGALSAVDELLGGLSEVREIGERHALVFASTSADEARDLIGRKLPEVEVDSAGVAIEIYKDALAPADFLERFAVRGVRGTHALGHTRMATESGVTPAGSHPFSTGSDLCLVHNGSLSNHNRLRVKLEAEGFTFRTQNDSEVAAAYLTWRLREGATLGGALEACLVDLDGFYTFAVGTIDGFAVLRDPIACKPAVMAETDEWVAMASEYRALATLPGAGDAIVWEPEPGVVYDWGRAALA
jgi:amidophosphoribosyltransferase